jgi:hypothetical protein
VVLGEAVVVVVVVEGLDVVVEEAGVSALAAPLDVATAVTMRMAANDAATGRPNLRIVPPSRRISWRSIFVMALGFVAGLRLVWALPAPG